MTSLHPEDRERFASWFRQARPKGTDDQLSALGRYGDLVVSSSARLGLVAPGDLPRFLMRHVRESLATDLPEVVQGASVLDIGSGAGLPGLPLAIVRTDLDVTLLEPRRKKAAFLERCILQLGLRAVRVDGRTLEALAAAGPLVRRTLAVSRALAWDEKRIAALGAVLLDPQGILIRFGPPEAVVGVGAYPIPGDPPRAVQVWPRSAWPGLLRSSRLPQGGGQGP